MFFSLTKIQLITDTTREFVSVLLNDLLLQIMRKRDRKVLRKRRTTTQEPVYGVHKKKERAAKKERKKSGEKKAKKKSTAKIRSRAMVTDIKVFF